MAGCLFPLVPQGLAWKPGEAGAQFLSRGDLQTPSTVSLSQLSSWDPQTQVVANPGPDSTPSSQQPAKRKSYEQLEIVGLCTVAPGGHWPRLPVFMCVGEMSQSV